MDKYRFKIMKLIIGILRFKRFKNLNLSTKKESTLLQT